MKASQQATIPNEYDLADLISKNVKYVFGIMLVKNIDVPCIYI